MITVKKMSIALLFIFFGGNSFSQKKGDLGLILSTNKKTKINLEYRKPINEKYKWKIGFLYGNEVNQFGYKRRIIRSSDTSVTYREYHSESNNFGLRLGIERRLKTSHFSVGADLNFRYINTNHINNENTFYVDSSGYYSIPITTIFSPGKNPSASGRTRHFFEPGIRLSLNLDLPLGNRFLVHMSVNTLMGVPIYMGESNVVDVNQKFPLGSPPSTINFEYTAAIGLRYILGTNK